MNWTGGQLHRSARQGTLSKTQRQNFARSRQIALDRASRNLTTFHGFIPGFTQFSSTGDIPTGICRKSQGVATGESLYTQASTSSRMPGVVPIAGGTHLDMVKRQLLQHPDWATVSAARPLEIAFTPPEEIERFGKRRKLNDHDRRRLSAAHGHPFFSGLATLCRTGRDTSPGEVALDQIKIRIDGHLAGHLSSSQGKSTVVPSSQSMLLDHEASVMSHPSGRESESPRPKCARLTESTRLSLQPSYSQPVLERFLADICRIPTHNVAEPLDNVIFGSPPLKRVSSYSSPQRPELIFDRIETQPFSAFDQLHQLQRSTIHDQVLPEQTVQTTALDYCSCSCSPVTTPVASPVSSDSRSLPYGESLSWLSHPRHLDDLSSPILGRPHAASPWDSIARGPLYTNSSIGLFQNVPTTDSLPEHVRLFGQLINGGTENMATKRE